MYQSHKKPKTTFALPFTQVAYLVYDGLEKVTIYQVHIDAPLVVKELADQLLERGYLFWMIMRNSARPQLQCYRTNRSMVSIDSVNSKQLGTDAGSLIELAHDKFILGQDPEKQFFLFDAVEG